MLSLFIYYIFGLKVSVSVFVVIQIWVPKRLKLQPRATNARPIWGWSQIRQKKPLRRVAVRVVTIVG